MSQLAPIILFVFNRPVHTLATLQALSKNKLVDQSDLFIYCDGPKNSLDEGELSKIDEVRSIVASKKWCRNVQIIERKKNWGLADNIIDGVTKTVNNYGKVIVLEDDIITSEGFLTYMNNALELYKSEPEVMHVSAYMFPIELNLKEDTFFYNTASCWGWGTWKEAWSNFSSDSDQLMAKFKTEGQIKKFNIGYGDFYGQLESNQKKIIKTWAVKWYASMFFNNGYSLHPQKSLTENIGHDNSGENCDINDIYTVNQLAKEIEVKKIPVKESKVVRRQMNKFYLDSIGQHQGNLVERIIKKIKLKTFR